MFTYAVTFQHIKALLPYGAHIEAAKGTRQQNFDYCTKNDTEHQRWPGTEPVKYFKNDIAFYYHVFWCSIPVELYDTGAPIPTGLSDEDMATMEMILNRSDDDDEDSHP